MVVFECVLSAGMRADDGVGFNNCFFSQPLEDVAGMTASFEIVGQTVHHRVLFAFATQSLIRVPSVGFSGRLACAWPAGWCSGQASPCQN